MNEDKVIPSTGLKLSEYPSNCAQCGAPVFVAPNGDCSCVRCGAPTALVLGKKYVRKEKSDGLHV